MSLNTGLANEEEIVNSINGLTLLEVNPNIRSFLTSIFNSRPDPSVTIYASRTKDPKYKADLSIQHVDTSRYISVKQGSGNSIHQETLDTFIDYLQKNLGANDDVIQAIKLFHWGDGTLDGSADISSRMSSREFIKQNPKLISTIQSFFNKHSSELLPRFLSSGIYNSGYVDYVYYGDHLNAKWDSLSSVIKYLEKPSGRTLTIGGLSYQVYGRSLGGKDDERRKSIQLKWSNMNSYFLATDTVSAPDVSTRIKGDNSHGFKNEKLLVEKLDGKYISDVPSSLGAFLKELFVGTISDNSIVRCQRIMNVSIKGNILVWLDGLDGNKKNISVLSGTGISVHQEHIDSFLSFLQTLGASDKVLNEFKGFHWGDGTTDGKGIVSDRLSAVQYKKEHPEDITSINEFLSVFARPILERFLKSNSSDRDVDYFLYSDTEVPYWSTVDSVIDAQIRNNTETRSAVNIGNFSIQAWNRVLNGNPRSEYKRAQLQVKWNHSGKDIRAAYLLGSESSVYTVKDKQSTTKINATPSDIAIGGLEYEYSFAQSLNSDKKNLLWEELGIDQPSKYWVVNNSFKQTSRIAGDKINPKSDCFIIRVDKNISLIMEDRNYIMSEEFLLDSSIEYDIVSHSGISIKKPESNNFTLQKMSFNTFCRVFDELAPEYFIGALLYTKADDYFKNDLIYATFNTTLGELQESLGLTGEPVVLKNKCISIISQLANKPKYRSTICFGDNIFSDPYRATYIFTNNSLIHKNDYKHTINVTTGSGRSSGRYTLAFK